MVRHHAKGVDTKSATSRCGSQTSYQVLRVLIGGEHRLS